MNSQTSKRDGAKRGKYSPWIYRAAWISLWLFSHLYNRLERKGRSPRAIKGPVLFVCNHTSNLDPLYVASSIPQMIHYLSKAELFSKRFVGWILRHCNAIPINREGVDRGALRAAVEVLRGGGQLLVFPEGRRSPDGRLGRAKAGVGMIAVQGQARCAPVYIEGTERAMPRGSTRIRPRKVRVYFGEPSDLPPRGPQMGKKEHYQLCADEMINRIAALRDAVHGAAQPAAGAADSQGNTLEDVG